MTFQDDVDLGDLVGVLLNDGDVVTGTLTDIERNWEDDGAPIEYVEVCDVPGHYMLIDALEVVSISKATV